MKLNVSYQQMFECTTFLLFKNIAIVECTLFSICGALGMTGCPGFRLFLDLRLEVVNLDC